MFSARNGTAPHGNAEAYPEYELKKCCVSQIWHELKMRNNPKCHPAPTKGHDRGPFHEYQGDSFRIRDFTGCYSVCDTPA